MLLIRRANLADIPYLLPLVEHFAQQDILLPKTRLQMEQEIEAFMVCELSGSLVGCGALKKGWGPLAEIRTLAVDDQYQGLGAGQELVKALLDYARKCDVSDVFVLTYKKEFFEKFGFSTIDKAQLPEKVWSDCVHCIHYEDCHEIAMLLAL